MAINHGTRLEDSKAEAKLTMHVSDSRMHSRKARTRRLGLEGRSQTHDACVRLENALQKHVLDSECTPETCIRQCLRSQDLPKMENVGSRLTGMTAALLAYREAAKELKETGMNKERRNEQGQLIGGVRDCFEVCGLTKYSNFDKEMGGTSFSKGV